MAFQIQEHAFSTNVGAEYSNEDDKVLITLISSSDLKNRVGRLLLRIPIFRTLLTHECFCEALIETLLQCMSDIPSTFLNGHDCDMVEKLSKMLHDSTIELLHGDNDNLSVFITVSKDSCHYNVLNFSNFPHSGQELPSHEFVQSLAYESGVYSLPAGASAIERLKAEDETEDDCAICMQGLLNGSEVARLPCSHIYHCHCILEWFVQRGTCPLCRFQCSHA